MTVNSETALTKYGQAALEELKRTIRSLHTKDEVAAELAEYRRAVAERADERWSIANHLRAVFEANGIEFSEDPQVQAASLSKFPADVDEVLSKLINGRLHEIYKTFPHGEHFLSRVLKKYAAPDDQKNFLPGDSLRLRILKIFVANDASNPFFGTPAAQLTEDVFKQLFDPQVWKTWIQARLQRDDSELPLLIEETRDFKLNKDPLNIDAEELSLLEKQFCAYLEDFYVVGNEKGIRRDILYKKEKAELVLDDGNIFAAVERFGCSFFTLAQFIDYLAAILKDYVGRNVRLGQDVKQALIAEFKLPMSADANTANLLDSICADDFLKFFGEQVSLSLNDGELSAESKRNLMRSFNLQLPANPLPPTITILNKILGNRDGHQNWSKPRRKLLCAVEDELARLVPQAVHEKLKADKLKLHHREKLKSALIQSAEIVGACGLEAKTWRDFFLRQLDTNKPNEPLFQNLQEIIDVADDEVEAQHYRILRHLKQFRWKADDTYADLFRRAWRRKFSHSPNQSFLQAVDDLANLRFDRELKTKETLYRLALLLNLPEDDPTGTLEKIFDDVYTDHFFTRAQGELFYSEAFLAEGIRWKSAYETAYVYFLNRKDLPAPERLKQADSLIHELKEQSSRVTAQVHVSSDNTRYYQKFFDDGLKQLSRDEFKNRLLNEYDISSPTSAALQVSAVQVYSELVEKLNEFITPMIRAGQDRLIDDGVDRFSRYYLEHQYLDCNAGLGEFARESDYGADANFVQLFEHLEEIFNVASRELLTRNPEDGVNRTDIFALFYAFFVNCRLEEFEEFANKDLIFFNFVNELDGYLDRANFKRFSVKSVVDFYSIALLELAVLDS